MASVPEVSAAAAAVTGDAAATGVVAAVVAAYGSAIGVEEVGEEVSAAEKKTPASFNFFLSMSFFCAKQLKK